MKAYHILLFLAYPVEYVLLVLLDLCITHVYTVVHAPFPIILSSYTLLFVYWGWDATKHPILIILASSVTIFPFLFIFVYPITMEGYKKRDNVAKSAIAKTQRTLKLRINAF